MILNILKTITKRYNFFHIEKTIRLLRSGKQFKCLCSLGNVALVKGEKEK